jgi:phenylacetate-CoA ligase
LPDSRLDRWLEAFEERGGTALAVSPMTLRRLLVRAAAGRRPLRSVRKLLIGGPYHDPTPTAEIARLLPDVEVWQLYGSFEAWVVGQRGPGCADGVFHLLPHQYAEIDAGRILVTTVGVPRTPPVIRYVIGDRGRFAACGCGRPDPAILIEGPLAPSVRVNGHLVLAQELVDLALETGEVLDAQVAVVETSGGSDRVELRVRLIEGVPDDQYTLEWIKYQALNGHLALDPNSADHADALQVVAVDRLPEYEPTGAATAR